MRRVAVLVGLVASIAIGGVLVSTWLTGATAQEGRAIPITVSRDSDAGFINDGDGCGFSQDFPRLLFTDQQIVIRDGTERIIALLDLDGATWEEDPDDLGHFTCEIAQNIAVPNADFYTVYLGDDRITGYSATDFPIDPMEGVWISLD